MLVILFVTMKVVTTTLIVSLDLISYISVMKFIIFFMRDVLLARQLNIWLRSKWRHFFKSVYTQFLSKFRIVGRGYKLYNDKNNLVFRLGYSHSIYYLLPMTMYLAKKEKSSFFWRIYGQDLEKGRSLLHYLKNFKQPNIYSSKGIFRANEWFIKKQGKKAYSV